MKYYTASTDGISCDSYDVNTGKLALDKNTDQKTQSFRCSHTTVGITQAGLVNGHSEKTAIASSTTSDKSDK